MLSRSSKALELRWGMILRMLDLNKDYELSAYYYIKSQLGVRYSHCY